MSTMIFPITVFAFEDGADASNLLGQLDASGDPSYTRTNANNAPGPYGLSEPRYAAIDEAGHRLFVGDGNNRVLVYLLDSSNELLDYGADYVLGQSTFGTNASGGGLTGMQNPNGLAYDSVNDRLFLADMNNHRVMVFDVADIANGEAAINILGTGSGETTQNTLQYPADVSYDSTNERLFVADAFNHRVMVFDLSDGITDGENAVNVLGQEDFVSGDSDTTADTLYSPFGISYDGANDRLFVADSGNNRVMVFDGTAIANGVAAVNVLGQEDFVSGGSGTTQDTLNSPTGLTYDSDNDRLFVAEQSNHRVTVFNVVAITDGEPAINVLGQENFTSASDGITQDTLYVPYGLVYDNTSDQLFVGDRYNNRVMIFDANIAEIADGANALDVIGHTTNDFTTPIYTTRLGNNSPKDDGFSGVYDIVVDTTNHRLFVADQANNRVLVFNLDVSDNLVDYNADYVLGQENFESAGPDTTQDTLNSPRSVAYDSSNSLLFVTDQGNNRVLVFDVTAISNGENAVNVLGQPNFTSGGAGLTASTFSFPVGLTYDSGSDYLFVADASNNRVMVFDVAAIVDGEDAVNVLGQEDFESSGADTTISSLSAPFDVAHDSMNSRLFVVDTSNHRVMVFNVAAIVDGEDAVNVLGQEDFVSAVQGGTTADSFNSPSGVAYDSTNSRLFVSTYSRVLVFEVVAITNGEDAINVLGQEDFTTTGQQPTAGGMYSPVGLAYTDESETLWVADSAYNRATEYDVSPSGGGGGGEGVPEFSDYLYMITLAACGWYVFTRLQKHQPTGGGAAAV